MNFVADIVEHETIEAPVPPGPKNDKKIERSWKSRAKSSRSSQSSQQANNAPLKVSQVLDDGSGFTESEKIHMENLDRLSRMDEDQIAQEREELMSSMDPKILESLILRANTRKKLDPQDVEKALNGDDAGRNNTGVNEGVNIGTDAVTVTDTDTGTDKGIETGTVTKTITEPQATLADAIPSSSEHTVHFPTHPTVDLDPSAPDFFEKMHEKYFPDLAVEPEKLAWMKPVSQQDTGYELDQDSLSIDELRFDFRGDLLSPRTSRELDTNLGLHHHGDAPLAAGYTIVELAHLARSTVQAQRCIAIQTLGRILFKLGKEKYGREIGTGLLGLVDRTRVVETLNFSADENKTSSVGVRAYAIEALWLWKQGSRPAV